MAADERQAPSPDLLVAAVSTNLHELLTTVKTVIQATGGPRNPGGHRVRGSPFAELAGAPVDAAGAVEVVQSALPPRAEVVVEAGAMVRETERHGMLRLFRKGQCAMVVVVGDFVVMCQIERKSGARASPGDHDGCAGCLC